MFSNISMQWHFWIYHRILQYLCPHYLPLAMEYRIIFCSVLQMIIPIIVTVLQVRIFKCTLLKCPFLSLHEAIILNIKSIKTFSKGPSLVWFTICFCFVVPSRGLGDGWHVCIITTVLYSSGQFKKKKIISFFFFVWRCRGIRLE